MTKLSALKPADYNPRSIDPAAVRRLKSSLESFGLCENLIANSRTGLLVGGHQRFAVLLHAVGGDIETEIPVVWKSLDEDEERALNIALNGEYGKFDKEKMSKLIQDMESKRPEMVNLIGLSPKTIADMVNGSKEARERSLATRVMPEAAPSLFSPGSVHAAKDQFIVCNDARLVDGTRTPREARIAFIDGPHLRGPYDVRKAKEVAAGRVYAYYDKIPEDDWRRAMESIIKRSEESLAGDGVFFCFSKERDVDKTKALLLCAGLETHNLIVWDHGVPRRGESDYQEHYSFLLFGWRAGRSHRAGSSQTESNLWQIRKESIRDGEHPHKKPVELFRRAIRNHSEVGELIVDYSVGHGTSLVAAQSMGRKGYGVELNAYYCDAAHARVTAT
jgi:hypothetical protein